MRRVPSRSGEQVEAAAGDDTRVRGDGRRGLSRGGREAAATTVKVPAGAPLRVRLPFVRRGVFVAGRVCGRSLFGR